MPPRTSAGLRVEYGRWPEDTRHGRARARPASERRVRAGPCIADHRQTCHHGVAGHDHATIPVEHAGHRQHVRDRLSVEPVRLHRTGADDGRPSVRITKARERPVARGSEQGDRPRVVVAGQGQNRNRSDSEQEPFARLRLTAVPRPEVPRVVDEAGILGFLMKGGGARGLEPPRQRRATARRIHDQIRAPAPLPTRSARRRRAGTLEALRV